VSEVVWSGGTYLLGTALLSRHCCLCDCCFGKVRVLVLVGVEVVEAWVARLWSSRSFGFDRKDC